MIRTRYCCCILCGLLGLALSLAVLVASTVIVGYGNYLGVQSQPGEVNAQR